MIDIDKIKHEWSNLKIENEALKQKNHELTRRLANERVTSNQQKLAKSYRIGYFGFVFPLLGFIIYHMLDCSLALSIAYGLYGIILGCYDLWYMNYVKSIDYATVSTVEAMSHASKVVIYQNRATVFSILLAIAIIIPFFYEMSLVGGEVVVGGVIGGITGGILGTRKCIKNHRLARKMLSELRAIDE